MGTREVHGANSGYMDSIPKTWHEERGTETRSHRSLTSYDDSMEKKRPSTWACRSALANPCRIMWLHYRHTPRLLLRNAQCEQQARQTWNFQASILFKCGPHWNFYSLTRPLYLWPIRFKASTKRTCRYLNTFSYRVIENMLLNFDFSFHEQSEDCYTGTMATYLPSSNVPAGYLM